MVIVVALIGVVALVTSATSSFLPGIAVGVGVNGPDASVTPRERSSLGEYSPWRLPSFSELGFGPEVAHGWRC